MFLFQKLKNLFQNDDKKKDRIQIEKFRQHFFKLILIIIQMIYQVQQSQESCPKCSRKYNSYSSSSSSSSQQEYEQVVIPLRKHVIQHNQNIEQTLNILQEEVDRLKTENDQKDKQISKLRLDMRDYLTKKMPEFPKVGKIYDSPELAVQTQNFFHDKRISKGGKEQKKKKRRTQPVESEESDDELAIEIQKKVKKLNKVKVDELQKLVEEVSYYQEEYMKIREKLNICLDEIQWMEKFCTSFVRMGEKVAQIQGEKLTKNSWPLRKKTKVSWKYFKDFVGQVLS